MYPAVNHFIIPLLIAEDERRHGRERATPELVRPTHRAFVIRRLSSRLLRGRAVASMVMAKPRQGATEGKR